MLIPLCDEIRRNRLPVMTFMMVVLHLALFVSALDGQWSTTSARMHEMCYHSGVGHMSLQEQQWLDYGTYWLLDKSWFAVMANLIVLLIFGPSLENRAGRLLFLIIYAGSAVSGGLLYSWFPHHDFPTLSSSGAIAGLLGAYAVQIDLQTRVRTLSMYYELHLSGLSLCFAWVMAQIALANYVVCQSPVAAFPIIVAGFVTGVVVGFATKELTPHVVVNKAGLLQIVTRSEANLIKKKAAKEKLATGNQVTLEHCCPYCHNENRSPLIDNGGSVYYQCQSADCKRLVFVSRRSSVASGATV